jgi:hypothetical protein
MSDGVAFWVGAGESLSPKRRRARNKQLDFSVESHHRHKLSMLFDRRKHATSRETCEIPSRPCRDIVLLVSRMQIRAR